jgi:hypothetical protein
MNMNNAVRHRLRSLSRAYSRQRSTAPVALNLSLCCRPTGKGPRAPLRSITNLQLDLASLKPRRESALDVTFDAVRLH